MKSEFAYNCSIFWFKVGNKITIITSCQNWINGSKLNGYTVALQWIRYFYRIKSFGNNLQESELVEYVTFWCSPFVNIKYGLHHLRAVQLPSGRMSLSHSLQLRSKSVRPESFVNIHAGVNFTNILRANNFWKLQVHFHFKFLIYFVKG